MPPKPNKSTEEKTPEYLRPYIFHGIRLRWSSGDEEATGDCPWCGREDKFSVRIATGQWRCLVCNEGKETDKAIKGGNSLIFLRMLWERSYNDTPSADYAELAADRRLLYPESIVEWQLAKSAITGNWLLPGYGTDTDRITGLYQYVSSGKRQIWMPTPTFGHHLLGMNLFRKDAAHGLIYLCEGFPDGIALWEMLGNVKLVPEESNGHVKYARTASRAASLLAEENVVAIAGCQTFNEAWLPLFKGQVVCLMCQNDHEKVMCGKCRKSYSQHQYDKCPNCQSIDVAKTVVPPASYTGMERIAKMLSPVADSLHYLYWGENGYDPSLTSGYDVRDFIT